MANHDFKIGDKIECRDDVGAWELRKGNVYTVTSTTAGDFHDLISVAEVKLINGYNWWRFAKVTN
jgi:hypothetical protein